MLRAEKEIGRVFAHDSLVEFLGDERLGDIVVAGDRDLVDRAFPVAGVGVGRFVGAHKESPVSDETELEGDTIDSEGEMFFELHNE